MKDNSKLIIGVLIGAVVATTLSILISSEKGQELVDDIKDAAGKAEKDLKKAYDKFEKKINKGKEYAGELEKKAGKFYKTTNPLMETTKQGFFKETQQLAEEYIKERLLLIKLQTAEKAANMAAVVFASALIGIFLFIILLLLSVLACYFLEELTGSWYYGFGIVISFYVILAAVLIYYRKSLFYKYVSNAVIKMFFEENENADDAQQA